MFEPIQFEYLLRLFAAAVCGAVIGFERKNRSKEAGIRTHCLVAIGAALMMIVSKYAFFDVIKPGFKYAENIKLDPSRVASNIANGIGFLGAGMIFIQKRTITGLTTAAGIWATSGIGMAIGGGMYFIGICTSVIVLLMQIFLHRGYKWLEMPVHRVVSVKNVDKDGFNEDFCARCEKMGVSVNLSSASKNPDADTKNYVYKMELSPKVDEEEILKLIPYECSIKFD